MSRGIPPKKSLGQNFLTDRGVLEKIAAAAAINPTDHILEIGPGKGALTEQLLNGGANVVAIELDKRLIDHLEQQFVPTNRFEVIQADILKVNLAEELAQRFPGRWKVVANLPYNISTQVLFQLLDERGRFSILLLMLQKEVGDRLAATPSTKEYGILSVFFQLYFDIRREFLVRPGSFYPVPKVDSVVLSFVPLVAPREDVGDYSVFRKIVKAAFGQRRKTLWTCLKTLFPDMSSADLTEFFLKANIDRTRRGETLSLHEFAVLSQVFSGPGRSTP